MLYDDQQDSRADNACECGEQNIRHTKNWTIELQEWMLGGELQHLCQRGTTLILL